MKYLAHLTLPESNGVLTLEIESEEGKYFEIDSDMTKFARTAGLGPVWIEVQDEGV